MGQPRKHHRGRALPGHISRGWSEWYGSACSGKRYVRCHDSTSPLSLTKCKVAVRLADKEEKGEQARSSISEQKERYQYAKHDGKASLFFRPDGQAMGSVEALDPSSVLGGQTSQR